jgi:hypothetical protein
MKPLRSFGAYHNSFGTGYLLELSASSFSSSQSWLKLGPKLKITQLTGETRGKKH